MRALNNICEMVPRPRLSRRKPNCKCATTEPCGLSAPEWSSE